MDGCKSNPEELSTTNASEHIPSDFSMSTISSFKDVNNKHGEYRGKDHMRHARRIINFLKREMKLLTK